MEVTSSVIHTPSERKMKTSFNRLLVIAEDEGIDIDVFAKQQHLDINNLSVDGHPLATDKYFEIVDKLLLALKMPSLGIITGSKFKLADLGVLGHAMLSSENLIAVFRTYILFRPAFGSSFPITYSLDDNHLILSSFFIKPDSTLTRYLLENWLFSLSVIDELVKKNSGDLIVSIYLPYEEPDYVDEYRAKFSCPIYFNCEQIKIVIQRDLATTPLLYSNQIVHQFCVDECKKTEDKMLNRQSITFQVKTLILNKENEFSPQQEIAEQLNLTTRTLRRRLTEEGTCYSKLLLSIKMDLAAKYQLDKEKCIKDIAYTLGYKDVVSYHRAFKAYFGVTPKDFSFK